MVWVSEMVIVMVFNYEDFASFLRAHHIGWIIVSSRL